MRAICTIALLAGCQFHHGGLPPDTSSTGVDAPPDAVDVMMTSMTQQLVPLQDTWLRQQFPTEVEILDHLDNESTDLRCGSGSTVGRANRMILQFDLGGMSGCQIQSATLYLYYYGDESTSVSPTMTAHQVTRAWSDTSATWASPWAATGGDFAATPFASATLVPTAHGWVGWDLTSLVTGWVEQMYANDGVELLEANDNTGNMGRKLFYSSRAAQDQPYLEVTCN